MTTIVNGKEIAEKIKGEIKALLKESRPSSLAIFYVGENPVIDSYVALKKKVGEELGIVVDVLRFPNDINEEELIGSINEAAAKYSGIIVQLPLPASLNKENILNAVPSALDVDVLSAESGRLFAENKIEKMPPVAGAIAEIVKTHNIDLQNKKIVIVGAGALVGKPVAAWLTRQNITYTVIDSENTDGDNLLKDADVIITGVGIPGMIKSDQIKEGVILIDAGTSTSTGKVFGDIDRSAYGKASIVSGVPGGVGPITVVSLFKNLFLK